MRMAVEDRGGTRTALLRGIDAGLASSAISIAGVDQNNAKVTFTAFQVLLTDDERRGDHFVAGEHGSRRRRMVGHCAGKVRITAGFDAGPHGGERKAAWHLVVAQRSVQGSWSCVSHLLLLYQENARRIEAHGAEHSEIKGLRERSVLAIVSGHDFRRAENHTRMGLTKALCRVPIGGRYKPDAAFILYRESVPFRKQPQSGAGAALHLTGALKAPAHDLPVRVRISNECRRNRLSFSACATWTWRADRK
jgi:hypothetical protein